MTPHDRKYGEVPSRPLTVWNGLLEHRSRIGDALWEFLWCIDRVTEEQDGVGRVFGGAPVKLERVIADLKSDKETTRRHLRKLRDGKYLRLRRTPYGHVIEVLKSKKFGIWGKEKPQNAVSRNRNSQQEKPQSAVSKEDHAVDHAIKQAAGLTVWQFLKVDGSRFCPQAREACTALYRTKNGQTPVEFVGACMDGIAALKLKIPPDLARRATELRAKARVYGTEPLPELEPIPWRG